ncbi:MAG: hypothetical protein ACE5HS_17925, partial [bacterium]
MKKVVLTLLPLLILNCAGTRPSQSTNWVALQLASMSVEEKVGQMMVPSYVPHFYNSEDEQFKRLLDLVKNYHVGGVMFFRGMPYEVARSIQRLQAEAELPLLVMADVEWGLPMR